MNQTAQQLRNAQSAVKTRSASGSWGRIFDLLRAARDEYRAEYGKLSEERDRRKQTIEQDYNHSSPRYRAELNATDDAFDTDLEILRKRIRYDVEAELSAARDEILTEVSSLDDTVLERLRRIDGFELEREEVLALSQLYAGRSYWSDKLLTDLASRNGIDLAGEGIVLQPSVGTRLQVLGELTQEFENLLSKYDGETLASKMILSDLRLRTAEQRGTNSCFSDVRTDEETAWRIVSHVRSAGSLTERGVRLANAMRNASESVSERLLAVLATSDKDGDVVAVSGLTERVNEWKNGKAQRFFEADRLFDSMVTEARENGDKAAAEMLASGKDNSFLIRKVERIAARDSHVREIAKLANEKSGESIFAVGSGD